MATLRLFANLREVAGVSRVELDGTTVGEILEAANRRFGPAFAAGAAHARVWHNGDAAETHTRVESGDEVALIPPVSGGAMQVDQRSGDIQVVALVAVAAVLMLANLDSDEGLWASAVVGAVAVWGVGLNRDLPAGPPLVATLGAVVATHLLGSPGYGLGIGVALVTALAWPVFFPSYRRMPVIAAGVVGAIWAAAAAASLLLARQATDPGNRIISIFLLATIGSTLVGALVQHFGRFRFLDSLSATVVVALAAAVGGAVIWEFDMVGFLLIGVGLALGLIAGRGMGSIMRIGQVSLAEPLPGSLTGLDGPLMAAVLLFPLVRLLL